MIQRIQSVYLLISCIVIAAMYFLPLAEIVGYSEVFTLFADGIYDSEGGFKASSIFIAAIIVVEVFLNVFIIFQYKKRNRQILLARLNLVIIAALMVAVFFFADYAKNLTGLPNDTLVNYKFASVLPIISLALNYLAIRAIKKDEELVRAADRLR